MEALALGVLAVCFWLFAPEPVQAQTTYHVSTSGSDADPGTAARPFRTVQKGVKVADPGDVILVHEGTYSGVVDFDRSGSPGNPITLKAAGDGPVVLTASLEPEPCSSTGPTSNRTLQVNGGVDHWTIQGLVIVGGILVRGTNADKLDPYVGDHSLPGRGLYDPETAKQTLNSLGSDGADYVQIVNNKMRGRGIWVSAGRYGRIEGNEIYNIDCGTGGGIWIGRFSDGWSVSGNYIHDLEDSAGQHYMSEGIRLGAGSMYNRIEGNLIERIAGMGRGIGTDVNASWNVIRDNRAQQTNIGFADEQENWGNRWVYNVSENNRTYGFRVGPSTGWGDDRTPLYAWLQCNKSVNNPLALSIGSAVQAIFNSNKLDGVQVYSEFKGVWNKADNRYEGSSELPPADGGPSDKYFLNCT